MEVGSVSAAEEEKEEEEKGKAARLEEMRRADEGEGKVLKAARRVAEMRRAMYRSEGVAFHSRIDKVDEDSDADM